MSAWRISGSSCHIYFVREVPQISVNSTLENTRSATWIDLIEQRTAGATPDDRTSNLAAQIARALHHTNILLTTFPLSPLTAWRYPTRIDWMEQCAIGATSEDRASNFRAHAMRDVPGLFHIRESPAVTERYHRVADSDVGVSWSESVPEHVAAYVHGRVAALLRSGVNPRLGSDDAAHASQSNWDDSRRVYFFEDDAPSHADVLAYIVAAPRTDLLALKLHTQCGLPKLDAQPWLVKWAAPRGRVY